MGPLCVVRDSLFKAKAKEFDVSEEVLESVIHTYQNKLGKPDFPSDDYLRSRFTPTYATYMEEADYKSAHKAWELLNSLKDKRFNSEADAFDEISNDEYYDLPASSTLVIQDNNGKFKIIAAEPKMATKVQQDLHQAEKKAITWTTGQTDAINAVSQHIADVKSGKEKNRFFLIEGKAGTGKTSILDDIIASVKGNSLITQTILVGAPTHKASMVIGTKVKPGRRNNATIINRSVQSMLGYKKNKDTGEFETDKTKTAPIEVASVVIIDEASLMSEKEMEDLEKLIADKRIPVIFLGDKGQLPPVRSGSFFKGWKKEQREADSPVFTRDDIKSISLTERVRQGKGSPILEYSDRFHDLSTGEEEVDKLPDDRDIKSQVTDSGALIVQPTNVKLVDQLLPLFKKAKETGNPNLVKIVTYTTNDKENKESAVTRYNTAIREALYPGSKPEDGFLEGDLIILNDNYKPEGSDDVFPNSLEGIVTKVHKADKSYSVKKFIGEELFDKLELEEVDVQLVTMRFNDPNGIAEIQFPAIIPDFKNTSKHERNRKKLWDYRNKNHKEITSLVWKYVESFGAKAGYAYAVSSHKSQGSTYDVVAVDLADITSVGATTAKTKAQSIYVGVTRASNVTIVSSPTSTEQRIFTDVESINNRINSVKAGTAEGEFVPETAENFEAPTSMTDEQVDKIMGNNKKSSSSKGNWDFVDLSSDKSNEKAPTVTGEEDTFDWDSENFDALPKESTSSETPADPQEAAYKNFKEKQSLLNSVIKFDEKSHTYWVNGPKADYSVTGFRKYLLGKTEEEESNTWLDVASRLGSAHDEFLRDFFMGSLKKSYPNMSSAQMNEMRRHATRLKNKLKELYGDNAIFITDEALLRVAATITVNGEQKLVAGTMDMVVIDEQGTPHVVDFKTSRSNSSEKMSEEKKAKYAFLITTYKDILSKTLGREVGDTYIAQFNLKYEAPKDVTYSFNDKQVLVGKSKIQDTAEYLAGKLSALFGLSMDTSEYEMSINPIKTSLQQRAEAKHTSAQTTSTKDFYVDYKKSMFSPKAVHNFTISNREFINVNHYVVWRKLVLAADAANSAGDTERKDTLYKLAGAVAKATSLKAVYGIFSNAGLSKENEIAFKTIEDNVYKSALKAIGEQSEEFKKKLLATGSRPLILSGNEEYSKALMLERERLGGTGIPEKIAEEDKKAETVSEEIKNISATTNSSAMDAALQLLAQQQKEMAEMRKQIEELKSGKASSTESPVESNKGEESKESKESKSETKTETKSKEQSEEEKKKELEKKLEEAKKKEEAAVAAVTKERRNAAAAENRRKSLEELDDDFFSISQKTETNSSFTAEYVIELRPSTTTLDEEERKAKGEVLDSITACMEYSSQFTLKGNVNQDYLFTIASLIHNEEVFVDGYSETITLDEDSVEATMAKEYAKEDRKFPYNPKTRELKVPKFTVGFTRQEIEERRRMNKLLNNNILKVEEIRNLAKAAIYQMSHYITMIQSNVNGYEHFFKTDDESWENDPHKDKDFTKMSRIEIIKEIGIGNLMNLVRDRVFNVAKVYPGDAIDDVPAKKIKKMNLIANNWEAFRTLGYDTLIGLEEISLSDSENIKDDNDTLWDDKTEDEVQEIFGSSIEHWQVGFRQVSTFNSLSKLIKRTMDSLYLVDEDGNVISDEFGLGKHVSALEAVSKILFFTQGARDINQMIDKLKDRVNEEKWLPQIIELLEGKKNAEGELIQKPNEQFRSQFYNNFKKYFQKYAITFKEGKGKKAKVAIKVINESQYKDTLLDNCKALENQFAMGYFPLKNKDGSLNEEKKNRLEEIYSKFDKWNSSYKTKTAFRENVDLDEYHALIKEVLDILAIEKPTDESIQRIFGVQTNFQTLTKKLRFVLEAIDKGAKTITSIKDYEDIVGLASKEMGMEYESVSYEAGKMYYSYVLPCYLGNLVGKLKSDNMSEKEFEKFMEDEYGRFKWFKNESGYRNYWLDQISRSKTVRALMQHVTSLHYMEKGYADKTPAEYIASMMRMYFFDTSKDKAWAYFRMPMMSNKPSEEYIKFKRISITSFGSLAEVKSFITKLMYNTFLQELDRIQAVRERNGYIDGIEGIEKHQKINSKGKKATFDKNGLQFCFMDFLPVKSIETSDGHQKFIATSDDPEAQEFAELIEKKLSGTLGNEGKDEARLIALQEKFTLQGMEDNYQVAKEQWKDEGFLTETTNKEGVTTQKLFGGAKYSEDELQEFFWNDAFAAINILQLTVTDTAYYVDTEDLQKRLAQLHAPGTRANVLALDDKGRRFTTPDADGVCRERTIYLLDDILTSEIKPNLERAFDNLIAEAKTKEEAKALEELKKSILEAFDGVNVADAQGYNSPTSYRKKMGVFGKWDTTMEEAYQKVIHPEKYPDANLADMLKELWQPLKPFVYSLVALDGHNQTLPEIKVSVQNKNSEYVLILADAIMKRAGDRANKLSVIYDIMEQSLNTNGEPNGKGIDTIQFMSAVNAGCSGVIDLNYSAERLEQIAKEKGLGKVKDLVDFVNKLDKKGITGKEKLDALDFVKLNEKEVRERLSVAFKPDGSYNLDYVHEIPFEDYMILQEVPAHFRGHEQAHGSQDRVLTFADIEDVDQFGDDNHLTVDGKEMTVAEAKKQYWLAIADNIEDSKQQLIKRFNLKGSQRAKNKALSKVLKDTILKDSRFGSDLLWACDLNEFGEFNIPLSDPILSNRILQLLNSIIKTAINKQEIAGGPVVQVSTWGVSDELHIRFKDDEGNLMLTEEEFTKEEFPDDYIEKYKLKKEGQTYKQYCETQAGVAYFECYVPILDMNIAKDFTIKNPDGTETIDVKAMEKVNPKFLEMVGYRIPTESKYSMVPIKVKGFLPASSEGIMMPAEITSLAGSDFDIDKLYIMRHQLLRDDKGNWHEPQQGTRAYRDNLIISTQMAVLQSEQVQQQLFTPGNFDVPKMNGYLVAYIKEQVKKTGKSSREVWDEAMKKRLELGNDSDFSDWCKKQTKASSNLIFNYTQVLFHKQNMTAGKLIGIFALANVSHGFISLEDHGKHATDENPNPSLIIPAENEFTLGGIEVSGNFEVDSIYTRDGKVRISNNLAAHLAASVDAVKDPILNLMNINEHTANIVTAMLRMGFRILTVALFASLPVLVDLIKDYAMANAEHRVSLQSILDSKKEEFIKQADEAFTASENPELVGSLLKTEVNLSDNDLIDNLDNSNPIVSYLTLRMFEKMLGIADTFGDITHMTRYNSITAAVGPFAADTMLQRTKVEAYNNNGMIGRGIRRACSNPILTAFRLDADEIERDLLGANMILAKDAFDMAMKRAASILGYEKGLPSKLTGPFSDFYMSFYVNSSSRGSLFDLSLANREEMIKNFPDLFQALKSRFSDNILVNAIQRIERKSEEYPSLILKTRGMSSESMEDLKQAWVSLYESSDPVAHGLALSLIEYNFFKGGFGFSPKTFMKLVPNSIKTSAMPEYIDTLNHEDSYLRNPKSDVTTRMIYQFILHNPKYIKKIANKIEDFEPQELDESTIVVAREGKDKKAGYLKDIHADSFIKVGNDIYFVKKVDRQTATLMKVDHLGGQGQGFEIDPEVDFPKSIFSQEAKSKDNNSAEGSHSNGVIFSQEAMSQAIYELLDEEEISKIIGMRSKQGINLLNEKLIERGEDFRISTASDNLRVFMTIRDTLKERGVENFEDVLKGAKSLEEHKNLCKGK